MCIRDSVWKDYFRHVFFVLEKGVIRMNVTTKKITTIGMLCALALIVNVLIHFPLVPAVSFLSYDPKDIIIVIGGFIYGPLSALVMSVITSFLEIMYRGGTLLDLSLIHI